jgi:hypothetical protein
VNFLQYIFRFSITQLGNPRYSSFENLLRNCNISLVIYVWSSMSIFNDSELIDYSSFFNGSVRWYWGKNSPSLAITISLHTPCKLNWNDGSWKPGSIIKQLGESIIVHSFSLPGVKDIVTRSRYSSWSSSSLIPLSVYWDCFPEISLK